MAQFLVMRQGSGQIFIAFFGAQVSHFLEMPPEAQTWDDSGFAVSGSKTGHAIGNTARKRAFVDEDFSYGEASIALEIKEPGAGLFAHCQSLRRKMRCDDDEFRAFGKLSIGVKIIPQSCTHTSRFTIRLDCASESVVMTEHVDVREDSGGSAVSRQSTLHALDFDSGHLPEYRR
jgi:hypothetical protein